MSDAAKSETNLSTEQQPVEQQPASKAERTLMIWDDPDGAKSGWGDDTDPTVGGALAADSETEQQS